MSEMHCRIQVWMFPGCLASSVTGPLDVFTAANAIWAARHPKLTNALFSWSLHTLDGQAVTTASGIALQAEGPIDARQRADVVMLPGIYVARGNAGLLRDLTQLQALTPLLRQMHARGSLLAANCSASFLLAETGLLDGGHATTAWWLERLFRDRYPAIELRLDQVLTEYQGLLCSGAATSFLNLALYLVERFAGAPIASQCARVLLIDANRQAQTAYMTSAGQEGWAHGDALVARAQKWMHAHACGQASLRQLAAHLAVSERTVIRHFHKTLGKSPTAYAQQLRIEAAKRLLENSNMSLNGVSERIGYRDISAFHRLFKRETSLSPAQYRQQFRQIDRLSARP